MATSRASPQSQTLHHDLAGVDLKSKHQHVDPNPPREDDETSDWDASDREEEAPAGTQRHGSSVVESNRQPPLPHGPGLIPQAITPQTLQMNTTNGQTPSATSSPSRPNTNPFRRASDYKPVEAFQDTAIWGESQPMVAELPGNAPMRKPPPVPTAFQSEEQTMNPFATELEGSYSPPNPKPSREPDLLETDNPWYEEHGSGAQPSKATAQPAGIAESEAPQHTQVIQPILQAKTTGQRNEHYQIRNVRWYDAKSSKNPRQSPVLIQNANGPCPLLALVNALSLSTPSDMQTPLIETLRTRQQVSLGLLLEAVFDELMSGRRGATAQQLPDVGELHSFLVTLHTGMNVNPRFVAEEGAFQSKNMLGGFEPTREMRMYSTFAIPLVHGWIPSEQDATLAAFTRTAQSYEDAQNVHFREEEIERKLGTGTVTPEEQTVLMDLASIKAFFNRWPTQLTEHGLESIKQEILPGQIFILFRNDHFSTVYKEPRSGQLMTLITDEGYATHDEIVWESLVDISGTKSEMFAGDFNCVSHSAGVGAASSHDAGEWTTVGQGKSKKAEPTAFTGTAGTATVNGNDEQEDHDLALALQLQEEEEDRHRSEQAARRRRENELSQNFIQGINQDSNANAGPEIPPRRSGRNVPTTNRPDEDPDLPSYEQAASTRAYHPPPGHPSSDQRISSYTPSIMAQASAPSQPQGPLSQGQPMTGRRRNGRPSMSGSTSTGSPFDNQRRTQTQYDATADRREGCSVM